MDMNSSSAHTLGDYYSIYTWENLFVCVDICRNIYMYIQAKSCIFKDRNFFFSFFRKITLSV